MRIGAGETLEIGKRVEGKIDFAGRAAKFVSTYAFEKIAGQFARLKKLFEGEMGVDAGRDNIGRKFLAGLQGNACSAAVLYQDFADGSLGTDFDAGFAGGISYGVGDRAGTSPAEAPGAERAVDFAHVVMEKNVGS